NDRHLGTKVQKALAVFASLNQSDASMTVPATRLGDCPILQRGRSSAADDRRIQTRADQNFRGHRGDGRFPVRSRDSQRSTSGGRVDFARKFAEHLGVAASDDSKLLCAAAFAVN